jgi:hypothetical protein
VLLDSDETRVLRQRLCALLDADDAAVSERSWTDPKSGKVRTVEMSDLGWWFTRFSLLRNELMHGIAPTIEEWKHDGALHTDVGDWWLRQAIKETIALDGHDDIRMDALWRGAFRGAFEYLSEHGDEQPGSVDPEP